jgi:hypothetical protein
MGTKKASISVRAIRKLDYGYIINGNSSDNFGAIRRIDGWIYCDLKAELGGKIVRTEMIIEVS